MSAALQVRQIFTGHLGHALFSIFSFLYTVPKFQVQRGLFIEIYSFKTIVKYSIA